MYITTTLNAFMARTYPKKTGKGEPAVIPCAMIAPGYSRRETIMKACLMAGFILSALLTAHPYHASPKR